MLEADEVMSNYIPSPLLLGASYRIYEFKDGSKVTRRDLSEKALTLKCMSVVDFHAYWLAAHLGSSELQCLFGRRLKSPLKALFTIQVVGAVFCCCHFNKGRPPSLYAFYKRLIYVFI